MAKQRNWLAQKAWDLPQWAFVITPVTLASRAVDSFNFLAGLKSVRQHVPGFELQDVIRSQKLSVDFNCSRAKLKGTPFNSPQTIDDMYESLGRDLPAGTRHVIEFWSNDSAGKFKQLLPTLRHQPLYVAMMDYQGRVRQLMPSTTLDV